MKNFSLTILVLAVCLTNSSLVVGQATCSNRGFRFQSIKLIETTPSPSQPLITDFNKDGNLDIAYLQSNSSSFFNPSMEIQLGNGRGEFAISKRVIIPFSPFSFGGGRNFGSGDFNGDGNIDLCIAEYNHITVWLGNGQGDFGMPIETTYPGQPTGVAVPKMVIMDVNNDGRSDLCFGGTSLVVVLASSSATFSVPKVLLISSSITLLEAADFNADNKLDLVATSASAILVFINEGDGKFSEPISSNLPTGSGVATVGDFNGDQRPDVIVSTTSNNTTTVYFNNGSGSFNSSKPIFNRYLQGMVSGDFNKDGKLDFAFTQSTSYSNYGGNSGVCIGDGTGNFPTISQYSIGVLPQNPLKADVNKDGFLDLLFYDTTGLDLVYGKAAGIFDAPQFVAPDNATSFTGKFAVGDINKDSIPDMITFGTYIYTFEGLGNGGFKPAVALDQNKYKLGFQNSALLITDVNKDGNNDIVIAGNYLPPGTNTSTGSLTILYGNAAGGFNETDARSFPVGINPTSLKAADFNADGFLDFAVVSAGTYSVSILINNRNGQFQAARNFTTGLDPQTMTTADFNGDNLVDLVIGNRGSAGFSLFINDGAGGFNTSLVGIGANPGQILAGDFNLDGKQDLLIAQVYSNNLTFLPGNGNGTFGSKINTLMPGRVTDFVTTDANQDNKTDLVITLTSQVNNSAYNTENRFSVYVGDGTGKFTYGTESIALQAGNLLLSDLNKDGLPDISVSSQYGVQTYLSACNPLFNPLSIVVVNAASYKGIDIAPAGIVSAFGSGLSPSVLAATALPLPTTLNGTVVKIKDSKGVERTSPLFFVSPSQVNFLVPADVALGVATVSANNGAGQIATADIIITSTKPALFTANSNGAGIVAAEALRLIAKTKVQVSEPLLRYDDLLKRFVGVPVVLPPNSDTSDILYLILYGTGIRGRSATEQVRVYVGGVLYTVDFAGAHCCFAGVDQINVRIFDAYPYLRGEVDVQVEVDGKLSNIGKVVLE